MKYRNILASLSAAFVLGIGLTEPARAQAPDPCTVYMCMAGMSGSGSSGPDCAPAIATFFSIQVWSPWYNAPATAMMRQAYLMGCAGAMDGPNAAILESIIAQWGMMI